MATKMMMPMMFFVIHFLNVDDDDIQTASIIQFAHIQTESAAYSTFHGLRVHISS